VNISRSRWILLAAAAVIVAACGGSGSSSSSSTPVGIAKTQYVTGAIGGFGSVIVNGVHYDSNSATVTVNGNPGAVSELKVGQVVHITAKVDAQGNASASSIDVERLVQGAVQAIDLTNNTLTVAGQVIQVDNTTSFDPSIPGGSLAGLKIGDLVEVHGFVGASGVAVATRIEMATAGDKEIEVTGPLSGLDTTKSLFTVGTQLVDYTTATLVGFPTTGPANGDIVEAEGTTINSSGALQAVKVKKHDGGMDGHAGDGGELEGLITRFASATDFDVNGQKVTTTSTTVYVGGAVMDLQLNARVEVHGSLDSTGTLVANKVVFQHHSTLSLSAPVETVSVPDPVNSPNVGTLQLLGLTIEVTADTRHEDDQMHNQFFTLANLNVGDWVQVSGYPDPASTTGAIIATKLERHGPQAAVELRGLDDSLNGTALTFTISGVGVVTTSTTVFKSGWSPSTAAAFYATTAGQAVDVRGTWSPPTLTATQVRFGGSPD